MNPTPLRGSLVAMLLGAGYRQTVRRLVHVAVGLGRASEGGYLARCATRWVAAYKTEPESSRPLKSNRSTFGGLVKKWRAPHPFIRFER